MSFLYSMLNCLTFATTKEKFLDHSTLKLRSCISSKLATSTGTHHGGHASLSSTLVSTTVTSRCPGDIFVIENNEREIPVRNEHRLVRVRLSAQSVMQRFITNYTRCSAIAERSRCRVRYSFGQKWKTGTIGDNIYGHHKSIFNYCDIMGPKIYRIR